ncbi:uncharacterized protein LOC117234675 [Bombus vosnesenskii]|uniref:Uncharacterized protein LOC117234675 n=1 Tax=Bombus vosnesenskii TaxID=207650 RepID=A0A6J3KFQ9_9HYME|nr:uncharacterized protein LOC117234675 [Bombus vosnesenskii]XP_050480028.1 uncharacterized protein LOC126868524 [Bombus huntii]
MLVSLIPFFLVVRVTVDESVWKYGPEYVFDVEMNVTSTPMNHDGVQTSNYTVMNLFCRPTDPDGLFCHLGNVRRQSIDITNDNKIDIPEEQSRHLMSEEPFEIRFSENGIDYLTVNDQVEVEHLNNIKLIAERFNIGVNLNGVPDGTFHITENTTIGECGVTVAINHYPSKRMMNKIKNDRYDLQSLPRLNKVPSETILIQKTTNLNNCSYYASFYFGSYGANIVVEADLDSHLESSTTRVFVSDYQFVSSITRMGTLGTEKKKLSAMMQYVSLSLKDIRAAKRELFEIPNSSITTIVANSETKRIFSK